MTHIHTQSLRRRVAGYVFEKLFDLAAAVVAAASVWALVYIGFTIWKDQT